MMSTGALRYMLPWLPATLDEIEDVFVDDCWSYGVELNRKTLEALVQSLEEQSLIKRKVMVEELFAPVRAINFKIRRVRRRVACI
jgi:4,5-dihydroxyphthalate decarboxylase